MAGVEDYAHPVGLSHEALAQWGKPAPLGPARVGRAVAQLVVLEVDRTHHPHAHVVEGLHQRQVAAKRIAILHRDEDEALAPPGDVQGLVRGESQLEFLRMGGDHLVDLDAPDDGRVAGAQVAVRAALALRRVDGEEAAIDAALHHARIVDLGSVNSHVVPIHDAPARPAEVGRGVEVGVEDDQALVQGAVGLADGGGLGQGRQGGPGKKDREGEGAKSQRGLRAGTKGEALAPI